MKTKNNKVLYGIISFLVICIVLFGFVLALLIKENSQCVQNPFTYAVKKIKITNPNLVGISPMCSCQGQEFKFWFDDQELYSQNPYISGEVGNINLSNFTWEK